MSGPVVSKKTPLQKADKRQTHLGILVIDAAQRACMQQKLVECTSIHPICIVRDCRFLREYDFACDGRVDCEQAPVHEAPVAQVGIVDLLGRPLEHLVHKRLDRVGRALVDEQLNGRSDERELHLDGFLKKVVRKVVHEFVGVIDAVRELPDDPDHRRLCLGLVEDVEVLTELWNDELVSARISPEDVLYNDSGFLHDVGHLRLDQGDKGTNTCISCCLDLDCDAPDRAYGFAHKVDVYL